MNKLLIITGGTKGIGKAIIKQFASEDFDIITCARNEKSLQQLKSEIIVTNPGITVEIYEADLSEIEGTIGFINFIKNSIDRIPDVLVNNTGVFYPGQIHNEEVGVLEKTMDTNLFSAYRITKGLMKGMMARGAGHIFNICSTASIEPYPRGASYCISKFALLGFTKVLREEMKDYGVRVTAVIPGSTLTPTWDGTEIPEEDFMKPSDVASSIYAAYKVSINTVVEEIIMRPQKGDV